MKSLSFILPLLLAPLLGDAASSRDKAMDLIDSGVKDIGIGIRAYAW